MTINEFAALTESGALILDGATGSNLRASGMPSGVCSEKWIMDHPEPLIALQGAYLAAGSQIVYAPTFGANEISLSMYGMEGAMEDMNRRLVAISRRAVGDKCFVAGDMTTTGKMVDTPGAPNYDQLLTAYRKQAKVLFEEGVDLFAVETMLGVTECCAAIEAIRSVCSLPVMCTLTLDAIGGAYFDGDADQAAEMLPAVGANAVGVNCGQGPELYESLISRIAPVCSVPFIAKPNAGLPVMQPDGSAVYSLCPEDFAKGMLKLKNAGAKILGGCCGTTPNHIRALKEICG